MQLQLFSNSTNVGQDYLQFPLPHIKSFIQSPPKKPVFIPYAAVRFSYNEYEDKVNQALNQIDLGVKSIHHFQDPAKAVQQADLIIVGGGNSFHLLAMLQRNQLLDVLRKSIIGGTPYVGWSAGSNITCPSIKTTNDMPIIEPKSFSALNIIPFQINPHFTSQVIPNHGGESRDERIIEFCAINTEMYVLGLSEGSYVQLTNEKLTLLGDKPAKLFKNKQESKEIKIGSDLSFLL